MKLTRIVTRGGQTVGAVRLAAVGAAVTLTAGLTVAAASGALTGGSAAGLTAGSAAGRPTGTAAGPVNAWAAGCQPGAPAGAGSCARSATAARQQAARDATVTLLTGDEARLVTAPGGRQSVTVAGHAGTGRPDASLFMPFSYGGDQYLFPATAVPYLGSVLDPRLFDVSYLARAGLDDSHSGTIPVTVTYRGSSPPAVPGLHLAHAAAGAATGTISKAGTPEAGALLARQTAATARHAAPVGLLPGLTRIALAQVKGAPPLPPAPLQAVSAAPGGSMPVRLPGPAGQPGGAPPYRTLRLTLTGPSTSTAFALGIVQNVGDSRLDSSLGAAAVTGGLGFAGVLVGPLPGGQDSLQVSVPAGTYSAGFVFLTPHPGTVEGFDGALAADPQFTVGAGTTTVSLDARHAVPYSASLQGITAPPVRGDLLQFARSALRGPGSSAGSGFGLFSVSGAFGFTGSVLSATPTAPATEGEFTFDASSTLETVAQLTGTPDPSPTYTLDFPGQQVPSSLTFTVPRSRLAALHTQLYQASSGAFSTVYTGCESLNGQDGLGFTLYDGSQALVVPLAPDISVTDGTDRTDYLYEANPRISLFQPFAFPDDCSERVAAPHQVRPGQQITEVWNKEPLVPGPALASGNGSGVIGNFFQSGPFPAACTACRQDDNAFVSLTNWGDSDPGHYGRDGYFVPAANFAEWPQVFNQMSFSRDGKLAVTSKGSCFVAFLASGSGCAMAPQWLDLPLLPRQASYRLDWSYPRSGDPVAVTDTVWDFTSAPARGTPLAGNLECAPDPTRGCAFLPLLFLTYDLALNHSNQAVAGGPFQISFTVAHQQGQASPAGVSATVSASFDDGTTWTTPVAATSQGGNQFTATVQQPQLSSTSGFASLRVTAKDGAGNSITQTIIRAYGLTS